MPESAEGARRGLAPLRLRAGADALRLVVRDLQADRRDDAGRRAWSGWRESDSILLGAVGWPGVPDHISLWGLLIPIRRGFDQYVNLRPCKLMPGVRTPLAGRTEADIDFYVVRENTEGEYSSVGGRMFEGTDREFVSQQSVFTRNGVDRDPALRVRTGDDAAEEAPDLGHQVERHHLHHAVLGRAVRGDGQSVSRHPHRPVSTSTSCARISCSIRTGSTWWWDPTCSATS